MQSSKLQAARHRVLGLTIAVLRALALAGCTGSGHGGNGFDFPEPPARRGGF
ncbi:MAG: hypothetical protein AAFQ35_12255 [Pseudomonadota bacterium]